MELRWRRGGKVSFELFLVDAGASAVSAIGDWDWEWEWEVHELFPWGYGCGELMREERGGLWGGLVLRVFVRGG